MAAVYKILMPPTDGIQFEPGLPESSLFDTTFYISRNPDLCNLKGSPWLHYIQYGRHEKRDARYRLERIPADHPIRRFPPPIIMENCFYAKAFYNQFTQFLGSMEGPLRLSINQAEDLLKSNQGRKKAADSTIAHYGEALFISGEPNTAGHHYRVERTSLAIQSVNLFGRILTISDNTLDGTEIQEGVTRYIFIWRLRKSFIQDSFLSKALALNIPIFYDIDDYMFEPSLVDQDQIDAIRYLQLNKSEIRAFYSDIRSAIQQADYAISPTIYLNRRLAQLSKPTHVIPNTYSVDVYSLSRHYAFLRQFSENDIFRIGYISGSATHQKDFSYCAKALEQILSKYPNARLVLYRDAQSHRPFLDLDEFPGLLKHSQQIEHRDSVYIHDLPIEISSLDLNIAPLELNEFCHSKSELKYFEAAICGVATIASPTETYKSCIKHGYNGFLAETESDWVKTISLLIDHPHVRESVAAAALSHSSIYYGPCQLKRCFHELMVRTSKSVSHLTRPPRLFSDNYNIPEISTEKFSIIYHQTNYRPRQNQVSIVIPNYNYSIHIESCLESIYHQTHAELELIVCDDKSTDNSIDVILAWLKKYGTRFSRVVLTCNQQNSGLGATRNLAVEISSSYWYFAVDPDNLIAPLCIESCLSLLSGSYAHFCYPLIRQFDGASYLMGDFEYDPFELSKGNTIDAMALVSKSAFFKVGGYYSSKQEKIPNGWEDYDFWCKCIESDMHGISARRFGELAFYRVHANSMLATESNLNDKQKTLINFIRSRHPWTQPLA
jgi:glycosyltransferase involved in cell wall biosynthesis